MMRTSGVTRRQLQRLTVPMLLAATLAGVANAAHAQEVGSVATMEGAPEGGRDGAWSTLAIGNPIHVGDGVRTGADSRARIVLLDGSVLNLGKQAQITIAEATTDESGRAVRAVIQLHAGALEAAVGPDYTRPGAAFDVKTQTALATVSGTEFVASYDPVAEVSTVTGVAGQVQVYSLASPLSRGVLVARQEATTVAKGELPSLPRPLTEIAFRQRIEELEFAGVGRPESLGAALRTASRVPPPDRAPRHLWGTYDWPIDKKKSHSPFDNVIPPPTGPGGIQVLF
jgi:ferric-dicitrate binding protein FerR (iron transport regulator)